MRWRRDPCEPEHSETQVQCSVTDGHGFATERLSLRSLMETDLDELVVALDDPEARAWQGWTQQSRAEMRESFQVRIGVAARSEILVMVERASGSIIGFRGWSASRNRTCLVGTAISARFRGRGLGTEELIATVSFLHHHVGFRVVAGFTDRTNAASRRQMEKAGMVAVSWPYEGGPLPNGRVPDATGYASKVTRPHRRCGLRVG